MFISVRTSGLVRRLSLISTALLAFVCNASGANAQTAPQLLPYIITTVAGGGTTAIAAKATCPVSGFTSTDAFGDGCLATEVKLNAPRFVATDKNGVVFFSDSGNALIRRIDPTTGIITAVAGGAASSPGSGTVCGTGTSTNTFGDGCPANLVKLSKPEGLAFSSTGDLYFADNGNDNVRKIAATGGVITTTGIVTHIVGNTTFGYNVNNTSLSGPVNAATQGYLNFPYGIAFDATGNLYIADEGNNALEVVNMGTTTETIQGMSVPAGTIAKFAGYGSLSAKKANTGDCPDFVSTSSRGGCYFGSWTDGSAANVSNVDSAYDLAVDAAGNVYFANEFNDNVGKITAANIITNYAGIQGGKGTTLKRAAAGSFSIGSNYNVAIDTNANLYTSDAVSGVVWRVDNATKSMYVIAGGATASTLCSASTDAYGDGCPATQATLSIGTLNTSGFATAPGVAGLSVDPFGSLYITDATTSLVRMASSGTNFGPVGASQATQIVDIHFAASDGPASSGAYAVTVGSSSFSLGTANCTTNSDNTTDCLLPITATPTTPGLFTGTLQVTSTHGGVGTFPLSGTYVQSPITRTSVTAVPSGTCTGTTISTATAVTLTATLVANGPSAPTGTITFLANGKAIGTPQSVTNLGTTAAPAYGATLSNTFTTAGTYTITATYSGDSYFKSSTGQASTILTSSVPTFTATATSSQESAVTAGGTALYSFTLAQSVYTGTITFACTGLPSGASCVFSPASITSTGCTTSSTVALSVITQQAQPVKLSGFDLAGRGPWQAFGVLAGLSLALLIGLRRRRMRFGQIWIALALLLATSGIVACGKGSTTPASPSGNYTITVTGTGSTGVTSSFTVPLKIQ